MVFVDPLAVMLIGVAIGTAIGAFYFYFAARGQYDQVKSLITPAIGVGAFNLVAGFYMSFAWPMVGPYAYNMLFGDPLLLFGLLMIIAAVMAYRDQQNFKLGIFPIMLFLLGIYVIVGAYSIVQYSMESGNNMITAMGMYLADGIGALLAPILYLKPTTPTVKSLYYAEWIILGIGTVFALIIGYSAFNMHLGSPP